jgi:hypothetical protein
MDFQACKEHSCMDTSSLECQFLIATSVLLTYDSYKKFKSCSHNSYNLFVLPTYNVFFLRKWLIILGFLDK